MSEHTEASNEPVSDGTVAVPIELVRAAICAIEYVAEDLRERAEYDDRDDNSEVGDNRRAEADSYDEDYRALIALAPLDGWPTSEVAA